MTYHIYDTTHIITLSPHFHISYHTRDQTGASECISVGTPRYVTVLNSVYKIRQEYRYNITVWNTVTIIRQYAVDNQSNLS